MKKTTGTRLRPTVRTPEDQRKHRAEQAARAILAGRNVGTNWARIARHLVDLKPCAEYLDLPIPAETLAWVKPVWVVRYPAPEVVTAPVPVAEATPEPVEIPA